MVQEVPECLRILIGILNGGLTSLLTLQHGFIGHLMLQIAWPMKF